MTKKKLTNPVVNELKGSSWFRHPMTKSKPGRSESAAATKVAESTPYPDEVEATERKSERTNDRTEKRSIHLPIKRLTKRHSFEFYQDQLVKLNELKIRANLRGQQLSLSEVVRVALDAYLAELELSLQ